MLPCYSAGTHVDMNPATLTLGALLGLHLHQHADTVANVCASALKELTIEMELRKVAELWRSQRFKLHRYTSGGTEDHGWVLKGEHLVLLLEQEPRMRAMLASGGHSQISDTSDGIVGTDEVMQLLEDVSLNLQSMLSSRFVQPFADEVQTLPGLLMCRSPVCSRTLRCYQANPQSPYAFCLVQVRAWELRLGRVGETLATWLAVQRRWMYLEAIFSSSDDLRQQLPQAS